MHLFLTSALDELTGQLHALTALHIGERAPSIIEQKAGWATGHCAGETIIVPLMGIEPGFFHCPSHCLITIPTELYTEIKHILFPANLFCNFYGFLAN
jgi:hypothetical protein